MQATDLNKHARQWQTQRTGFPSAFLYLLATASLTLMSLAYEPRLAPPLIAFAAMVALTCRLGRRLFGELAYASRNKN